MNWELIDEYTQRAKVHKGWLVRVMTRLDNNEVHISIAFVPDSMHGWTL